jgi:hypothetical protein
MGDTDTECMRIFFLIFAFNILKEIFFFFQDFMTPLLTPHVSDTSTSDYSDLDVLYSIYLS